MRQQIGFGGALIEAGRTLETNQTFETLEGELDAPSQTIKRENVFARELLGLKRSHDDHPIGGDERFFRELIAFPLGISPRLASRLGGGLRRLLDGNEPHP